MIALIIVSVILMVVGGIWFVVVAFKESIVWGLVVLFVPFASLVFLVKYWQKAKASFAVQVVGTVLYVGLAHSLISNRLEQYRQVAAAERRYHAPPDDTGMSMGDKEPALEAGTQRHSAANATPAPSTALARNNPVPTAPSSAPAPAPVPAPIHHRARHAGVIRLIDAKEHIGEAMRIFTTDHIVREGTLREVHTDALVFERDLSGGSLTFSMRPKQIARLETLDAEDTQ